MSRKRDKLKGFFGVKSSSSSPALTPAAPSVGSSVPMAVLPTGAVPALATVPASQTPTNPTQNNPNIDKARIWWREHRQGLMGALESALTIAEKALVVVPPAQAAVGAAGAALKDLRLMDENKTMIQEIVDRVDDIIADLAGFTFPSPVALPTSMSPDAVVRIEKFNERLSKIKTSAAGHAATTGNFLQRLLDAERISEELNDAWKDMSLAYDELTVATVLGTEAKVVGVHARVEDVQTNQISLKNEALLDRLQPVKSAFHDAHGAAPACLEGTRTKLLDEIATWMTDPSSRLVYWLTGVAGTGKTTIAESVAYVAADRKCLAATFFFSRTSGSADRRRAAAVIPTIAYQLANRHQMFRDCICAAISTDRDVGERQVAMQAKSLLSDALGDSRQAIPLPLVIVLDALDECDKENGREGGDLIPVLLHSLEKLPFCIKIFVTSRPEPGIKNMFSRADITSSTVGLALHRDIEQSIVREDIGRYLRHEFNKLAHERFVPPPFPSESDFQTLVDRASNLFIYVRTIVMYVSSDVEDPIDQLADVLRADESRASKQFADLDALYTQILIKASDIVGRDAAAQRQLRDVLASLVLVQESLPIAALAVMAGVEERQCKMILRCLSSVLLYEQTPDEPIRLIHPSFPDFLTHDGRCTDARYFISGAEYHSRLALRCLQIMNADLRQDICDLRDPYWSNSDIPALDQLLDSNASIQLRYACKYWHVHVQLAGCFNPNMITALEVFCTKHLLHWLELLSLINQVPVALRGVPPLLTYLESCDNMRDGRIHTLLTDADRLLLAYKIPIIEGALHVYHSALATMPSCLLLEEAALHDGHGIPFLITNRAPGWGVRETILEVHSENGFEFTYSPNGKLIASVSADRDEIQVWDVTTGTALNTISVPSTEKGGEFIRFSSVAFSPNSQWIVSARTDFTVRLWDVVTGSQHRVMSGHTGWVSCLAFSPDGTIIVSCSDDRTLRVWDVCTGTEQRVITGHSARVNSLAFAPNGQTIVSASSDSTLRVWDALTGTQLRVIEGDNKGFYDVAFSPDGATIASGSSDGTLQLWSATTNMQQHTLVHTVHTNCAYSLSFSPDSRSIVSCEVSSEVRIWDVTTGIEKCRLREGAMAVAYSPDGKSIAMALCKGTIRIWDTNTSVAAPPISEGHQTKISSVTFSSDGLLVASGSYDQTVRIWDAVTGTERHVMEVGSSVWSVAFSPDNRTVACGQLGGTVQLWDVPSGSKQYSMTSQHTQDVYSVAFSSDGKSLVSYSPSDGMARAWDVASGAEQHILTHPVDPVAHESGGIPLMPVAFSPDGKTITLLDGSVVIGYWDLTIGQPKYTESTSPYEQTPAVYPFHGPEQHHFGEVENRDWILHCNGQKEPKRVCWLPPERRGEFAYSGTKVCVGEQDGMIMILDFSPVDLPQ